MVSTFNFFFETRKWIEGILKVVFDLVFGTMNRLSPCCNLLSNFILKGLQQSKVLFQPVITTKIYVLHKITIPLKFMSYVNSDLPIPAKKLQTAA